MPKLWNQTIAAHRQSVRVAAIEATASLVQHHGVGGVSMARIAEMTGIGRATLYRYFPDIDAILLAWHEAHIEQHLAALEALPERSANALDTFRTALRTYGQNMSRHGEHPLVPMLHASTHMAHAHRRLQEFMATLIDRAVAQGLVRKDIPARELAAYSLAAVQGGGTGASLDRRIILILDGLAPEGSSPKAR